MPKGPQETRNCWGSERIRAEQQTGKVFADAAAEVYPGKATAPIDLLREFRAVFVHDAAALRRKQELALSKFEAKGLGAQAYANENAVRRIDATLRDWG